MLGCVCVSANDETSSRGCSCMSVCANVDMCANVHICVYLWVCVCVCVRVCVCVHGWLYVSCICLYNCAHRLHVLLRRGLLVYSHVCPCMCSFVYVFAQIVTQCTGMRGLVDSWTKSKLHFPLSTTTLSTHFHGRSHPRMHAQGGFKSSTVGCPLCTRLPCSSGHPPTNSRCETSRSLLSFKC